MNTNALCYMKAVIEEEIPRKARNESFGDCSRGVSLGRSSRFGYRTQQLRNDIPPYRWTRALPPAMTFSTSLTVTMEVSTGVVMASAPCAAP